MISYLEFEKPVAELESRIAELRSAAEGDDAALTTWLGWIEAGGPPAARVDRVDVERGEELAWTRVEAVLKCTGEALHRDPRTVRDDEAERISTQRLPLPVGWVGTVATPVPTRLSWAARGAPSRTTTA